jgi:FkbM family methyltransferase
VQQPDEVVVTYRGKATRFEAIGGRVERELRRGHFYEEQMLRYIEALGLGGAYVDVGAYVGTHALFFATHCAASHVHAFEPRPRHLATLRRHVEQNDLAARVTLHADGLSDRAESVPIELDRKKEQIACRRLDELIDEPVSVIKIDVEGMEEKVLGGAAGILRTSRPLLFIEANSPAHFERHRELLAPFGYQPTGRVFNASPTYEFAAPGAVQPRTIAVDDPALWVPDDDRVTVTRGRGAPLRIVSTLGAGEVAVLTQAPHDLRRAPSAGILDATPDAGAWFFQASGRAAEGTSARFSVREYARRRTAMKRSTFGGRVFLPLELRSDTRRLRLSLRVSGPGELELERLALHVAPCAAPAVPRTLLGDLARIPLRWLQDGPRSR